MLFSVLSPKALRTVWNYVLSHEDKIEYIKFKSYDMSIRSRGLNIPLKMFLRSHNEVRHTHRNSNLVLKHLAVIYLFI